MPKINVNIQLKDFDGTDLTEGQGPAKKNITCKSVLINALCAPIQGENVDGTEKYKRYKLADKINKNDEAQLSAEDIVLLKMVVGKLYFPLIVGQIYDLLEPQA